MMVSLLQEHLPQLRAGREIVRSYLVPEQALVLRLIARQSRAGAGGSISVSIQAASPLLRPFVPTTVLEFDAQNRLLRSSGRILPSSAQAMLTTTHQPDSYPEVTCGF